MQIYSHASAILCTQYYSHSRLSSDRRRRRQRRHARSLFAQIHAHGDDAGDDGDGGGHNRNGWRNKRMPDADGDDDAMLTEAQLGYELWGESQQRAAGAFVEIANTQRKHTQFHRCANANRLEWYLCCWCCSMLWMLCSAANSCEGSS